LPLKQPVALVTNSVARRWITPDVTGPTATRAPTAGAPPTVTQPLRVPVLVPKIWVT